MTERSAPRPPTAGPSGLPATTSPDVSLLVKALQSSVGPSVVVFVPLTDSVDAIGASTLEIAAVPEVTVGSLAKRVRSWLVHTDEGACYQALAIAPGWQILMVRAPRVSDEEVGAIAVVRSGAEADWSAEEISTTQTFASLFGTSLETGHNKPPGTSRRRLDGIVTRVAVELMPVSAASLQDALEWTLKMLSDFFDVDTSFLRHNDFDRGMSVLVAEWPPRDSIPDPDPLGEVPFGVDPVFDATRELRKPYVMRPAGSTDAYQERVHDGSGIDQVSMAMVPLIRDHTTVGVLGFVKFGDRSWDTAETNALQAVASLLVQLQARVDAEERLAYQAYHDELTGLPNRRALLEELQGRCAADADQTALLFLDLDRFKVMNDFLGHGAGDRLLITISERLRAAMSPEDYVARLAGDEFVLLLGAPGNEHEVLAVADALLELVAEPIEIGGHHITRTASLGISGGQSKSTTAEELLRHADAALHLAKSQGGNQAVIFDQDLRATVTERSETELLFRRAIDDGGLLLYYQPEIDLRTGRLLAVEALVRWNHPTRGILAASSFISVAEETGLIVDLGRWVMAVACRQMAAWRQRYPQFRFTMRVNISPAQLATRNIIRLIADCLHDNDLPGRFLCLEITEHAVMQDVKHAVRALHQLKSLGVSLAIDDFGTGFSSMSQLKQLPVDCLKIDKSFVAGLGTDGGDRAIVDATVRLAESFGLDVVAEGVETVEMVHELLSIGCHRAQGFLLCRPKPASELEAILASGGVDPMTFSQHRPAQTEAALITQVPILQ